MGFIKLDFTVAAPVEHVWNFGLQAEKIPEWQFDVVAVKGISGSIDRKGTKYNLVFLPAISATLYDTNIIGICLQ